MFYNLLDYFCIPQKVLNDQDTTFTKFMIDNTDNRYVGGRKSS